MKSSTISSTSRLLNENLSIDLDESQLDQWTCDEQNDVTFMTSLKSKLQHAQGLLIALLAAFFFSLFGILNKKASFVTGSEQSAMRYLMQIILMISIAWHKKLSIFGPREMRVLLLKRGVFGAINFIAFGFSLKYIDPSDTLALYNTRLVIITVLAAIFLKEKLTLIHLVCIVLTISGVFLICQPSFLLVSLTKFDKSSNQTVKLFHHGSYSKLVNYIGIFLGLISAMAISCVAILIKKLSDLNVHYSVSVIYSSYIGLPTSLIISLIMYLTNTRNIDLSVYDTTEKFAWQIFYSLSSAICGCINQILVTMSNKHEDANKLALISTTNLFWSFVLQYLFLGIEANVYGATGALLIITAVLLNFLIKFVGQRLKENHINKK